MKKYIDRIIELRKSKSLMQKQIADKLGMTQVSYSKIETGKTELTLDRLFKIADILDVNVIELINPDFNEANFSKELKEENVYLSDRIEEFKLRIKEKDNFIEALKIEKSHIKEHLVKQMVSDYSFDISLVDSAFLAAKDNEGKQIFSELKASIKKMFSINKEYYIKTRFLSQSDFDNHYQEMKGLYENMPES